MFHSKLMIMMLLGVFLSINAQSSSLYDKHKYKEITADHRAFRVGDTVTIIVMETAHASASAGSADKSDFGLGAQAGVNDKSWNYGLGINSKSEGNASTQRRGLIRAQITAVVTSIDDNKNLLIKGLQTLTIDGEKQTIELEGRARRSDITSKNTIISNRLFDAQIKFTGSGSVSKGKEDGVFSKFFRWLGIK